MYKTSGWCRLMVLLSVVVAIFPRGQVLAQAPLPPEIEDPECLGINKQPAHATLMPYASLKEALTAKRHDSSFCVSLNGLWKFNWVREPSLRPVDFYKTDFDASGWKEIPVPSCWQLQGYGTPIYRNLGYTFEKNWPHVLTEPPKNYTAYVERDPVGSYRREFEVPKDWDGRRIFITFDGVDSAFFLWINGQKVGFSVNSRNAAEFDITQFLKPGKNLLAAEVYTYSAGSYIEDQDMWRMSGIFRNVTLWSAPDVHLRDFFVQTDLDAKYQDATLSATAKIRNFSDQSAAARELQVELFDNKGRSVAKGQAAIPALNAGAETAVVVSFPVTRPTKWTAETPNLYTTVLSLSGGKSGEIISTKTGFRKIEIKDRVFMVNGQPVKLKGANRHENWPDTGHYVPEEKMVRDLEVLKQGNANHVRTCHYSDDPRWYELCDEWGIYLNAEANCECHGYGSVLDREPKYEKAIVGRSVDNVENFKNHASVVMWSLGNECGGGTNFVSALRAVKAIDVSRPVHYEPFDIGDKNPADIDSHMYTGVAETERIATDSRYTKPFYLCEYAHAMFNSMGSLGDYDDVFDKYPALMGGAIWEWEDQGIWNRRDPKRQFLAYGGGFGDYPNDHYFIHKGVVFSDRSPKPHYSEMKRVFQWIGITAEDLAVGKIKIRNKYAFLNLDQFKGHWTLSEDGVVIDKGELATLALAPGAQQSVAISLKKLSLVPGATYVLRVAFTLAQDQMWAKAGYEVAAGQFKLPRQIPALVAKAAEMPPVRLEQTGDKITVIGTGFSVIFDKTEGTISQLVRDGKNLLIAGGGPRLNLWRAPHQKDDMWAYKDWRNAGLNNLEWSVTHISATPVSASAVRVETTVKGIGKNRFSVIHSAAYTIYGDGSVAVDNAVLPQGRKIPLARMGVRLQLDKALDQFTYLGRGPTENYSDRKRGSDFGLYGSTVREQLTPYAKPMECGNHEEVRWAAMSGKQRPTLLVQAEDTDLQVSALPYTDEVMTPVEYSVDLPESVSTVVNVASRTLGVGSNGCGPRPLEPYMLWSVPADFSYVLRLLPAGQNTFAAAGRLVAPQDRFKPVLDKSANTSGALKGKVIASSSYETGEGAPAHAVDGNSDTFWHSRWSGVGAQPPHFLVIDYAQPRKIATLRYLARADGENGHVKDYEVYLSKDGQEWGRPVAKGQIARDKDEETISLSQSAPSRYLKFVMLSEHGGRAFATVAELEAFEADSQASTSP
ncbi:MAG: glycoside hydrolase family 2 TIM barrel-domain containing protein [Verrucomicrobiota bacterium]